MLLQVVAICKTIKENPLASCPSGSSPSRQVLSAYKLDLSRRGGHRESCAQTSEIRLKLQTESSPPLNAKGKAPSDPCGGPAHSSAPTGARYPPQHQTCSQHPPVYFAFLVTSDSIQPQSYHRSPGTSIPLASEKRVISL